MADALHRSDAVHTVLGPIPATDLGIVATHDALLSVLPGAQYAHDITIDRSEIFGTLADKLTAFKALGGGTIVDSTGMFHGRDLDLLEALSRHTGVHIVASTGMGPESLLGGYFLTPQTNPPTPWPAEKFADLFTLELTDGMVIPRRERRANAGLIVTAADPAGITGTEESLFRGSARAALATGVAVSIRYGADALAELQLLLDEGLPANRVLVAGLDRVAAVAAGAPAAVATTGAYVCLDNIANNDDPTLVDDAARVRLVTELIAAGHLEQILLSSGTIGVSKGIPDCDLLYGTVLTDFVPLLTAAGVTDAQITRILVDNPRELLTVRTPAHA